MTLFAVAIPLIIRENWKTCLIYVAISVGINLQADFNAIPSRFWVLFCIITFLSFFFSYYLCFQFQRAMLKWHGYLTNVNSDHGFIQYILRNIGLAFLVLLSILPFGIVYLLITTETMPATSFEEYGLALFMSIGLIFVLLISFLMTRLGNWITAPLLPNPPSVRFQWNGMSLRVFWSLLVLLILSGSVGIVVQRLTPFVDPSVFWFYQMPVASVLCLLLQTIISILTYAAMSIIITQAYIDRIRELPGAAPTVQP